MNRYGDTALGMVESALEFLDVCEDEGFRAVVFSMKSSNAQVAIQAYRLLAARLGERAPGAPSYPFHVGVTEAGDAEDGRVKSAIGIGSLLEDGIGDTIRVSLTEDPVKEIPVAAALARHCEARWTLPRVNVGGSWCALGRRSLQPPASRDAQPGPRSRSRWAASSRCASSSISGRCPPSRAACASRLRDQLAPWRELACEGWLVEILDPESFARLPEFARALAAAGLAAPLAVRVEASWLATLDRDPGKQAQPARGEAKPSEVHPGFARAVAVVGALVSDAELAAPRKPRCGAALRSSGSCAAASPRSRACSTARWTRATAQGSRTCSSPSTRSCPCTRRGWWRRACARAARPTCRSCCAIAGDPARSPEPSLLAAAVDLGAPLCDGIGDAVALAGWEDAGVALDLAYRILQGARLRTTRTEFISCPSCGRTLFDLEETTARIKARTQHLSGVKIAIMGCIVNGPGEMADADFGYVGSGPGTVNLYVGKQLVERHLPQAQADDRLVALIREHGRWVDALEWDLRGRDADPRARHACVPAVTDDWPLTEYSIRAHVFETQIPEPIFDVSGVGTWCPSCFADGRPVPALETLPAYLATLAACYHDEGFRAFSMLNPFRSSGTAGPLPRCPARTPRCARAAT